MLLCLRSAPSPSVAASLQGSAEHFREVVLFSLTRKARGDLVHGRAGTFDLLPGRAGPVQSRLCFPHAGALRARGGLRTVAQQPTDPSHPRAPPLVWSAGRGRRSSTTPVARRPVPELPRV